MTENTRTPLEEREAKRAALRRAIDQGLLIGPAEPFDVERFIAEKSREPKPARGCASPKAPLRLSHPGLEATLTPAFT